MAHQPEVMGGVLVFHKLEHIVVRVGFEVKGFGDLRRVAVDGEMVFYLVDDGPGKEQIFDIDLILPGGASQYNRQVLIDQVVTNGPEVGESARDDLAGAAVQGHVEELGAVGGSQDERFPGYERPGIFKRGVAMFQTFRDHPIPFTGGNPVDLPAELDTFGDAVDRYHAFGAVMQGGGNGGGGAEDIDDHYYRMVHIIKMQQSGGKGGV